MRPFRNRLGARWGALAAAALIAGVARPAPGGPLDPTWRLYAVPRDVAPIALYDAGHRRMLMIGMNDATDGGTVVWSADLDSAQNWAPLYTSGAFPVLYDGNPIVPSGGIVDPLRNRVLVWGSDFTYGVSGTWSLDLDSYVWTKLGTSVPGGKGSGVVYDPIGDRVLVLGGIIPSQLGMPTLLNGVRQLSLAGDPTWSDLSPAGPLPTGRAYVSAIYDARRNRVVMFGGEYLKPNTYPYQLLPLDEVWELSLDGTPTWRFIPPVAPVPQARYGHFAAWDSLADRLVIYGGTGAAGTYLTSDLWSLALSDPDTARWSPLEASGTPGRQSTTAIFDPVRRCLVMGGGCELIGPTSHGSEKIRAGGRFALELGDAPVWTTPFADRDLPGIGGTAVLDPNRDRIVTMNTLDPSGSDVVFWSASLSQPPDWTRLGPFGGLGPGASLIADPVRDRLVVFGGSSGGGVWTLSLANGNWLPLAVSGTPPSPRSEHTALYDPVGDCMIVYGGALEGGTGNPIYLGDVWALSLGPGPTWTRLDLNGPRPPARAGHAAILDLTERRMLIYGGRDTLGVRQDIWSFSLDSLTWHQWSPAGTAPVWVSRPFAAYDGSRERMIVVRGQPYPAAGEAVFTLSLAGPPTWSQLNLQGTGPLQAQPRTGFYDASRDMLVLYRGGFPTVSWDTWAPEIWALYSQDWTTPVEVSLVEARIDAAGAHLVWSLVADPGLEITLERRVDRGEWQEVGRLVPDGSSRLVYHDRDVAAGHTYEYRLRIGDGVGARYAGNATLTLPAAALVFFAFPNAAGSTPRFRVGLPAGVGSGASIELFDVAGRRLIAQPLAPHGAGPFDVELAASVRVPSGLYLARLVAGGRVLARTRVAVLR
jgi:hypothetical protein